MSLFVAANDIELQIAGWTCFVLGVALLVAGVSNGLWMSRRQAAQTIEDAKTKLYQARTKLDEARGHIERTSSAVAGLGAEQVGGAAPDATEAVAAAGASADEATSALDQVEGIVAALPENLRFAGLLILIGTVLMSVATVQFGGTQLF